MLNDIKEKLSYHLHPRTDPCQNRGVDWPCDVAETLLTEEEITRIEDEAEQEWRQIDNERILAQDNPELDKL